MFYKINVLHHLYTKNMTKPNLILIDQDGVLADFEKSAQEIWQKRYGAPLPLGERRQHFYLHQELPQHAKALNDIYAEQGFFENLAPIDGAVSALHEMLNAGLDVRICTAPINAYRHCVSEKFAWVEQHLGSEWVKRVILTKDKTWVRGDVLIDDKPDITGALTPTWVHYVYDQPYNKMVDKPRVSWTDRKSWAFLLPS